MIVFRSISANLKSCSVLMKNAKSEYKGNTSNNIKMSVNLRKKTVNIAMIFSINLLLKIIKINVLLR